MDFGTSGLIRCMTDTPSRPTCHCHTDCQRCIIQDDAHDWNIEAGRMRDVYRNAAFCIAATAAADGTVGLFCQRKPNSLRPVKIELLWPEAHSELTMSSVKPPTTGIYAIGCHYFYPSWDLDATVLNRRAWVRTLKQSLLSVKSDELNLRQSSSNVDIQSYCYPRILASQLTCLSMYELSSLAR